MSSNVQDAPPTQYTTLEIDASSNNNTEKEGKTTSKKHSEKNKEARNSRCKWNSFKKFDQKTRAKVIIWCQLSMFIVASIICVASFTSPVLRKARPRGIPMWQWSLLITVLLGGPLVSKAIVRLVKHLLDRDISAKENVIYYVIGLAESAWVFLWFSMVFIAWLMAVDEPKYLGVPNSDKIIKKFATTFPIINVTLITIIMGSFFWILKELVIMKAKSKFHIRRFFDRIKEALLHQCVITALSSSGDHNKEDNNNNNNNNNEEEEPSYWKTKTILSLKKNEKKKKKKDDFVMTSGESSFSKRKKLGDNEEKNIYDISSLDDVDQHSVTCWGMKKVIQVMTDKEHLTYKDEKNYEVQVKSESEALEAADQIFKSLFPLQQDTDTCSIKRQELESRFPDGKVDDVEKCLLEGANAHEINKEVFKKWMVRAYWKRSSLHQALVANRRLFEALNMLVKVLLVFLIFILWLIMVRVETRKVIFFVGTVIAGSAFIFGDTCKKFLENLLFVFVVHPFDIGDCCLIDNIPVMIEDINVLSTTAKTLDSHEIRHYPNATISGQTISNYTRSTHVGDSIEFFVPPDTSDDKLDQLKKEIESYIKKNWQYWAPEDYYWVLDLVDMPTKIKMKLHFLHNIKFLDFKERQERKSKLASEIIQEIEKLKKNKINV